MPEFRPLAGSSFGVAVRGVDLARDLDEAVMTQQTLHAGARIGFASGERDARLLWRISVKGLPPICRRDAAA